MDDRLQYHSPEMHGGLGDEYHRLVKQLPLPWEPRWYQRGLWDYMETGILSGQRGLRAMSVAHRRWGKDEVALQLANFAAHQRVGNYWHMLPLYAQCRKAIWAAVNPHTGRRRIDEAFPKELRIKTLETEMFIEFRNGSTFQLVGSDNYNALVGAGPAGITISEWALSNPNSWGYLRPMLVENGGWAIFITTPRGFNHAHRMFSRASQSDRWYCEMSSVNQTGAVQPDDLLEALHEYVDLYGEDAGEAYFRQEYLCDFSAPILGAFYGAEMRRVREQGRIRPLIKIPGVPVHRAWDIGVRDDTSCWFFQVYKGRPYILDCFTDHGKGVPQYAKIVKDRGWNTCEGGYIDEEAMSWVGGSITDGSIDYMPHDAVVREWGTGRTRVEQMVRHGLNPVFAPTASKQDGIAAVRHTLALAQFDPRCEKVGTPALEQYRRKWRDDTKDFDKEEYKDWTCHLSDAMRYLALAWRDAPTQRQGQKLPPPPAGTVTLGPPEPHRPGISLLKR